MSKKIFLAFSIIISCIFVSTYSFAVMNEIKDMGNSLKNGMDHTEDAVENTVKGAAGAIKEGTNDMQNSGKNITNDVKNGVSEGMNNIKGTVNDATSDNSDDYSAARTASENIFSSNTMWTWIVLGIVAAVIIGLIWFYAMQKNNANEE